MSGGHRDNPGHDRGALQPPRIQFTLQISLHCFFIYPRSCLKDARIVSLVYKLGFWKMLLSIPEYEFYFSFLLPPRPPIIGKAVIPRSSVCSVKYGTFLIYASLGFFLIFLKLRTLMTSETTWQSLTSKAVT